MVAKIVQEVTPDTMLAASYEHFAAYELHVGTAPGGEVHDTPQLAYSFSGVPSAWMNSVVRTCLDPETDVDEVIESILSRARRRSLPLGWFLLPGTTPTDMGSRLQEHGLEYDDSEPCMSVDLQKLPSHVPVPDDLRIIEVLDPMTLEQWINAFGDSYGADAAYRQRRLAFRASLGLDTSLPYRSFLAFLGDQPIATSELFLGAGVAAIVWVGTVPTARRLGIGAAVTLAPLLEARRLGYRIGALTASPLGYKVYQGLGFQEMCRMETYLWKPAEQH